MGAAELLKHSLFPFSNQCLDSSTSGSPCRRSLELTPPSQGDSCGLVCITKTAAKSNRTWLWGFGDVKRPPQASKGSPTFPDHIFLMQADQENAKMTILVWYFKWSLPRLGCQIWHNVTFSGKSPEDFANRPLQVKWPKVLFSFTWSSNFVCFYRYFQGVVWSL